MNILSFPDELLCLIVGSLTVSDNNALGQTCKRFNSICNADFFWRLFIKNRFSIDYRGDQAKAFYARMKQRQDSGFILYPLNLPLASKGLVLLLDDLHVIYPHRNTINIQNCKTNSTLCFEGDLLSKVVDGAYAYRNQDIVYFVENNRHYQIGKFDNAYSLLLTPNFICINKYDDTVIRHKHQEDVSTTVKMDVKIFTERNGYLLADDSISSVQVFSCKDLKPIIYKIQDFDIWFDIVGHHLLECKHKTYTFYSLLTTPNSEQLDFEEIFVGTYENQLVFYSASKKEIILFSLPNQRKVFSIEGFSFRHLHSKGFVSLSGNYLLDLTNGVIFPSLRYIDSIDDSHLVESIQSHYLCSYAITKSQYTAHIRVQSVKLLSIIERMCSVFFKTTTESPNLLYSEDFMGSNFIQMRRTHLANQKALDYLINLHEEAKAQALHFPPSILNLLANTNLSITTIYDRLRVELF